MATTLELYNQIMQIGTHLGDEAAVLLSISNKLDSIGAQVSNILNQTTQIDVKQSADKGIQLASSDATDAAEMLSLVRETLETYASTL